MSCALLRLQVGKLTSVMDLFVQGYAVVSGDLVLTGDDGFQEIFGLETVELRTLCPSASSFDMARDALENIGHTRRPRRFVLQCVSPSAARKFSLLGAL